MRLDYGSPQIAIGVTFAILALLLAVVFAIIAAQARDMRMSYCDATALLHKRSIPS